MSDTLEAWVRAFAGVTEKIFAAQGRVDPIAFVQADSGHMEMIQLDFSDPAAKVYSGDVVRRICELSEARRVLMIAESWITELPKDTAPEVIKRIDRLGVVASGVPRREVIIYTAEDRTRQLTGEQEILREGKKAWLSPLKILQNADWTDGRLANLMPRPPGRVQ